MSPSSTKSRPHVSFGAVLSTAVVLWLAYFLLATIRWEILALGYSLEMAQLRLLVTFAGVIVTMLLWLLLRLFDNRALWLQIVAALLLAMPVSVLLAQINNTVFEDMNQKMEQEWLEQNNLTTDPLNDARVPGFDKDKGHKIIFTEVADGEEADRLAYLRPLTEIAFGRYFIMLSWCSLYFALVAISKARLAERREQEFRSAAKAAELRSLRYQVNPHFLFNTLNSLSALVMTGKSDRAEEMIQTISRFYRHSLASDPTADVPLEQEFDLQRLYLDIESVRFPERLRTQFILPEELSDARVPGMILQPLVENSVKYAVSAVNQPVTIRVVAKEEFDRLVLTVSDDGPGNGDESEHGFGIGLANVRDRLEARFGMEVSLVSGSVPGGYRSEIRIPLTRNG